MWLYIPKKYLTQLRSAKETTELVLGSPSLNPAISTSVAWREKLLLYQTWLRKWRKGHWMKRLNGLTFPVSEYHDFEDLWIASLRESRASRLASLENSAELKMNDGYGPQSLKSSEISGHEFCFLRKSADSGKRDSKSCSATLPRSGTMRNGIASELAMWKPRTKKEKESSSMRDWTTPSASIAIQGQNEADGKRGQTLEGQARGQDWPTATVNGNNNRAGISDKAGDGLSTAVKRGKDWPTITASTRTMGDLEQSKFAGNDPARPSYSEANQSGRRRTDANNTDGSRQDWSTPTANSSTGSGPHGDGGLKIQSQCQGLLNPRWVETLMGLPVGWTNYDYAATESYHSWLRSHTACLKAVLNYYGIEIIDEEKDIQIGDGEE